MPRTNTVNFAQTILTAPSSGITTLVGTVVTSDTFPATNFYATIQQVVSSEIIKKEVVLCSTRTGTTFTVTRGQDGTSAQDFTTGGGVVYLVIATASAHIQDIRDKIDTVATLAGSEALTNKSVNGVTLVSGGTATKYLSEDGTYTTPAGGSSGINIRYSLTGTYASTSTFTFSGDAGDAETIERSLFTCLSSADARKIGYVKSASHSAGTVTVTVVTDIDLASGDKTFKVAINRKVEDYQHLFTIPGEQIADASNPQGMFYRSLIDTYLLPVNSFVRTAAAGSGAACAWNVYKGTTNLFTSAQDMTTATTFDEKRPNTNTITAGDIITLRVTSSAGATNKASDLQVQAFIVPQTLYTTAD